MSWAGTKLGALVALLILSAVAGCGSGGPLSLDDLSDPIEVEAGEAFEIGLDANSSTGYEWQLAEPPAPEVVTYEGSDYVPDPGSEDEDGGGGEQILRFTAVEAGRTEISLEYLFADGEEVRPPTQRVSAEIIVG